MDDRPTHSTGAQSRPELAERAIGIFDSGVGGLTVAKEIYHALPNESTVYLGDTARVPYGTRSKETVVRFATQDARFLVEREVKAIVIACNTASALAKDELERLIDLPLFNVIVPAVLEAYKVTRNGRIGVIGTAGTIGSGTHERLLKTLDKELKVVAIACPLLVPLVEDGRLKGPLIESVIAEYLRPMREAGIDTLILGCTHYPLLKDIIVDYLYEQVKLIDPGEAVAKEVAQELGKRGLATGRKRAERGFFVTDDSESFRKTAEQFLGEPIENLARVDLP